MALLSRSLAWILLAGFTISTKLLTAQAQPRQPRSEEELRYWIENMVVYHRYSLDEVSAATGLPNLEIKATLTRFNLEFPPANSITPVGRLRVLPYPGGRHPRIGFLDGAIDPQRETKISVFTPWDAASYVVVDVPEAIWSNLGLLYLAHTHVPTVWTRAGLKLEPLEWTRLTNGAYQVARRLPNNVEFGSEINPETSGVRMKLWLKNGSTNALSDLRVQNCVMLKAAAGFNQQTNGNKVFSKPYVACGSDDGKRWIITAWEPCHRPWANPPVPCLHSDPKFADCAPGTTQTLRGWLSFYEGTNVHAEFDRLTGTWEKE